MQPLVSALKTVISQEMEIYAGILELSADKREALKKNDVKRLSEILEQEGAGLKKLQEIGGRQEEALDGFAGRYGLDHRPDLTEVISLVSDETDKQALTDVQSEFFLIISQLKTANDLNQKLLETQLQYNGLALEALTQSEATGDIYTKTGYVANEDIVPRSGLIDHEV